MAELETKASWVSAGSGFRAETQACTTANTPAQSSLRDRNAQTCAEPLKFLNWRPLLARYEALFHLSLRLACVNLAPDCEATIQESL
jgi:hypothetical protein